MTLEQRDKKLARYKIQLDDQLKVEGELLAHGEALKDGLVNTHSKITELQEELKQLFTTRKNLKLPPLKMMKSCQARK